MNDVFSFVGKEIINDEFKETLVAFTQINWFGRTEERWEGLDISHKLKSFDGFQKINLEYGTNLKLELKDEETFRNKYLSYQNLKVGFFK